MKFNEYDVIKRAIEILNNGGDKHPCSMGKYCPFCCISVAKGQLDEEFDCELPFITVIRDVMTDNVIERESDMPLVNARKIIDKIIGEKFGKWSSMNQFTKEQAIEICQTAKEKL